MGLLRATATAVATQPAAALLPAQKERRHTPRPWVVAIYSLQSYQTKTARFQSETERVRYESIPGTGLRSLIHGNRLFRFCSRG
jgi:hypothetical protein